MPTTKINADISSRSSGSESEYSVVKPDESSPFNDYESIHDYNGSVANSNESPTIQQTNDSKVTSSDTGSVNLTMNHDT